MAMVWDKESEKFETKSSKALNDSLYTPEVKEESIYLNPTEYLQHENVKVGATKKIIEEMPLDELAKSTGFEDKKALIDAFNSKDPKVTLALKNYFEGFGEGTFGAVLNNISNEELNEKRNNISWWNDERTLGEQYEQDGIGEVLKSLLFSIFGAIPQKLFQPSRDRAVQSGDFRTKNWDGSTGEMTDGNFKPQDLLDASISLGQSIPIGIGANAVGAIPKVAGYVASNSALPVVQEIADATLNDRGVQPSNMAIGSLTNMFTPFVMNQALRGANKYGLGSLVSKSGEKTTLPSTKQVVKDAEKTLERASKESVVQKGMGKGTPSEKIVGAEQFLKQNKLIDKGLVKNIDQKVLDKLTEGQKWVLYKALKEKGALDKASIKYMDNLEGKLKSYQVLETLVGNKVGDNLSSTEEGRKKVVSPLPKELQDLLLKD